MNAPYTDILNNIDFERITDHPNILVAAAFWDGDRYQAARVCYRYMRAIDDMIDCHKSVHATIAGNERKQFMFAVDEWLAMARDASAGKEENHELMKTIREFHIPVWPLEAFARSMVYDIDHNGFETVDSFIAYAQGASVAPASIFVHLSGLQRSGDQFSPRPLM